MLVGNQSTSVKIRWKVIGVNGIVPCVPSNLGIVPNLCRRDEIVSTC